MLGFAIMLRFLPLWLFLTSVLGQRDAWLTPDGSQLYSTDTFRNADLVTLAWDSMTGELSDLWVNAVASNFAVRLGSNINISTAGTFPWTITVGDEEIAVDSYFQLSFVPTGTSFRKTDAAQYQQSPVFILVKRGEPISSTSIVPAITTAVAGSDPALVATTSSYVTPTFISATASSTSELDDSPSMPGSVKAGIALGVVVATAIILGLLFWALRLRRKVKAANNHRSSGIVPTSGIIPQHSTEPSEKKISGLHEVTGDNTQPVEMNARPKTVYHEMAG